MTVAILAEPVPAVDPAGDDGKYKNHAAAGSLVLSGELINLVVKLDQPVESVDSTGNDGKNDGYRDASGCDPEIGRSLILIAEASGLRLVVLGVAVIVLSCPPV